MKSSLLIFTNNKLQSATSYGSHRVTDLQKLLAPVQDKGIGVKSLPSGEWKPVAWMKRSEIQEEGSRIALRSIRATNLGKHYNEIIQEVHMESQQENTTLVPGSCFCGAVKFEVTLPTLFCAHCHCSMCRRVHGAGYVTWIAVPYTQFHMVSGQEHLSVHHSSDHGRRSFCDVCSSSLFCESTRRPDHIDIVLANLSGKIDRDPQAHYYFSDRAEWVAIGDDLPRFGGKTGTEPLR